jgi:hypothetical protein
MNVRGRMRRDGPAVPDTDGKDWMSRTALSGTRIVRDDGETDESKESLRGQGGI